jgi:hypothetical protein
MKFNRSIIVAAVVAGLMALGAAPAVAGAAAAPSPTKPATYLSVAAAYQQFVSARRAFVQYRGFVNPALVRWHVEGTRYRRLGQSVIDFRTPMTFDVAGPENSYIPAERAELWVRVRRFRAPNGRIRTTWYDAHGGTGFARTPVTTIPPPAS